MSSLRFSSDVMFLMPETFLCSPDWSTCQLSPNAVCGSGIKTRMLDCVRSDGKSVDIKFCEEVSQAVIFSISQITIY